MSADFVATKNLAKPRKQARQRLKDRIAETLNRLADFGDEYREVRVREAMEWKRQANPDVEQFPLLEASAARLGGTPLQAANRILAADLQWRRKLALLETTVLVARRDITAGRNAAEIDAAVEAAISSLDAISE
jgi:hypothetical protein